jgi:hypothetical protein
MKCPLCDHEIPGRPCGNCGSVAPEGATFCMDCGSALDETQAEPVGDEDGFDFEDRVLCPDGACTGIIVDGKCTECGRDAEKDGVTDDA